MENNQNATPNPAPKKWADATPAGLVALAVACACFFAMLNGYVKKPDALPIIGCWLLGGFVVQLLVALTDLKEGKHAGGNTFTYFSAFFMLVSGIEMFVKYKLGAAADTRVDGYAWVVLTLVTWAWTPAFFKKINLLSFIIIAIDIALPFVALGDFKLLPANAAEGLLQISAWAFFTAGLIAVYLSAALVVNTAHDKKIFPNF